MAKRSQQRTIPRQPAVSPLLQPVAWSALLGAAVAIAFANPVYANPGTIPDEGARPVPAGALYLPGAAPSTAPSTTPPLLNGPLATKIQQKEVELAEVGDRLLKLKEEHATAVSERTAAEEAWQAAREALEQAQRTAETAATKALKDAASLPPGAFGSDLHGLSMLSRIQRGETGTSTTEATGEILRAQSEERAAHERFTGAENRVRDLEAQITELDASRIRLETELLKLKRDNQEQLAAIEREREAHDQRLGLEILGKESVAGKVAHPKALAALAYAHAQLGDPYQWGAEGPDRFDCSGLTWAAYRSVGYRLPRVAKDQYYATRGKTVHRSALLPGDLIFFASGNSWTSIYHMGMYVGNGKMIHAPTTGDVVKISTVGWSRFYAATRVFDAVDAPNAKPTPTPSPTPPKASPKPDPKPSTPPSNNPTEPPPTTRPSTEPSPTPSPSESPTPAPSESPSPSPSESSSPAPSGSTESSAGPSGSTEPSANPSITATLTEAVGSILNGLGIPVG